MNVHHSLTHLFISPRKPVKHYNDKIEKLYSHSVNYCCHLFLFHVYVRINLSIFVNNILYDCLLNNAKNIISIMLKNIWENRAVNQFNMF